MNFENLVNGGPSSYGTSNREIDAIPRLIVFKRGPVASTRPQSENARHPASMAMSAKLELLTASDSPERDPEPAMLCACGPLPGSTESNEQDDEDHLPSPLSPQTLALKTLAFGRQTHASIRIDAAIAAGVAMRVCRTLA